MATDAIADSEANAEQAEYWSSASGRQWITCQDALDQRFAPLTEALLGRADVRPGECAIDVGCGTGTTTMQLAAAAGAHGSVLAIDISEPLLAVARRRCLQAGHANVRLIRADAQTHRFERGCHDLVLSRFGVMFFDDPVAAFANLRRALRAGGRLAFACWRGLDDNPWFAIPLEVGTRRLGEPEPRPPRAPGPLAFAEEAYIDQILSAAGFAEVAIERVDTLLPGAARAREEADLLSLIGTLARLMRERGADEATRLLLVDDLADRLAPFATADGMRLPAAFHLVTATAPA